MPGGLWPPFVLKKSEGSGPPLPPFPGNCQLPLGCCPNSLHAMSDIIWNRSQYDLGAGFGPECIGEIGAGLFAH